MYIFLHFALHLFIATLCIPDALYAAATPLAKQTDSSQEIDEHDQKMRSMVIFNKGDICVFTRPVTDLHTKLVDGKPIPQDSREFSGHGAHVPIRSHQGVFNHPVRVVQIQGDYVQVAFEDLSYTVAPYKYDNTFWVEAESLYPVSTLPPALQKLFPLTPAPDGSKTVVLTLPFETFSVGTRFVRATDKDTEGHYGAWLFNPTEKGGTSISIPHTVAIPECEPASFDETRKRYVTLIENLIDHAARSLPRGVVPYVWGGGSYTKPSRDENCELTPDGQFWTRPHDAMHGFDCSNLVRLLFLMATGRQKSFFPKSSSVIPHCFSPLEPGAIPQNGDLVWTPGHVRVIRINPDEEKRKKDGDYFLEAGGYDSGVGKVRRVLIGDVYADVRTAEEFAQTCAKKELRKKDGSPIPLEAMPVIYNLASHKPPEGMSR